MPDFLVHVLPAEFGTLTAYLAVFVFLTTVPFCLYHKTWPDTGQVVIMLLSSVGAASGVKIIYLTTSLPIDKLGALADDKGALVVGGLATLALSMKEAISNWRKVAGV